MAHSSFRDLGGEPRVNLIYDFSDERRRHFRIVYFAVECEIDRPANGKAVEKKSPGESLSAAFDTDDADDFGDDDDDGDANKVSGSQ